MNLLWLNTGDGEKYARPRGMGWLAWAADGELPFTAVYDSLLAEFQARAGTDGCCFALCETLDRAKIALATGAMSGGEETALRAAVAPWN